MMSRESEVQPMAVSSGVSAHGAGGTGLEFSVPPACKEQTMTSNPASGTDHDKRLCELEIRLAFAEELLESLNRTVVRQQGEMDALRRRMEMLQQRLESVLHDDDSAAQRTAVEIPPHY